MAVPAKHRRVNSSRGPRTVYIVLQRSSDYGPRGDKHDVSCLSVHTTLAAANQAAKFFFEVDDEDETVERENGWTSWEDLDGTRVQTESDGKVRVISQTDTQSESLVWVEEKILEDDSEDDESENEDEDNGNGRPLDFVKRFKATGDSPNDVIDLTGD